MEKKEIPVTGDDEQLDQNQENLASTEPELNEEVLEVEAEEVAANTEEDAKEIEKESETDSKEGQNVNEMKAAMDKMSAELSEMKDKYLRLYAEFDNYRKRTLREREDMVKTAAQDTVKALLSTVDDFERAMKVAQSPNSTEVMPEGMILIYEKLNRVLEQRGLKAMESDGQPFDPDLHEALTKIPAPTPELKGKVVETVEKGFYLNDKIIRYAKVVVGQ